jgi:hypothetical protein
MQTKPTLLLEGKYEAAKVRNITVWGLIKRKGENLTLYEELEINICETCNVYCDLRTTSLKYMFFENFS